MWREKRKGENGANFRRKWTFYPGGIRGGTVLGALHQRKQKNGKVAAAGEKKIQLFGDCAQGSQSEDESVAGKGGEIKEGRREGCRVKLTNLPFSAGE